MVFPPPEQPKPTPDAAVATATTTSTSDATAVATSTATRAIKPIPSAKSVKVEMYTFKGAVEVEKDTIPFEVKLTNNGGGIQDFRLPTYFERNDDNEATDDPIQLANPTDPKTELPREVAFRQMAGIGFGKDTTFATPEVIPFEVVKTSDDGITYRWVSPDGIEIIRDYSFRADAFEIEMAVTVRNNSGQPQRYALEMQSALRVTNAMKSGSGFFSNFIPPADHLQALCHTDDEVEREDYRALDKKDDDDKFEWDQSVNWVAMDRQYFLAAVISRDRDDGSCRFESEEEVARSVYQTTEKSLRAGEEKRHKFTAYLGVKKQAVLSQVDAELEGAVDYKIFGLNLAPLCAGLLWVLSWFYGLTGSWGWAIIGLTVLVRLVLFPLNQRQGKSMRAMSALKPEMAALKEKYADDRQRMSEETMALYRKNNVNPAGGCLPTLIQMPIWFALYRSLWVSVDLYQQEFWWITDLTTRDPYWILPVGLVVVMFLQQKMMPSTMDPAQQKMMMYTMPLVFGGMMSQLPAGLCLYIFVNTLLAILQQHVINRSVGAPKEAETAPEASA